MSFGTRLREVLKRKTVKNSELAEKINRKPYDITNWLTERSTPDPETIEKIAHALEIPPDELISDNPIRSSFVRKVDLFLISAQLSRKELMKMANISREKFQHWEIGRVLPSENEVKEIAVLLGVSPLDLIDPLDQLNRNPANVQKTIPIPIFGKIPAGPPEEISGEPIGHYYMPEFEAKGRRLFGLIVKGDSMTPRINPGDLVIVEADRAPVNGKVYVTKLGPFDEFTLKRFYRADDTIILKPDNPMVEPIILVGEQVNNLVLVGRVILSKQEF